MNKQAVVERGRALARSLTTRGSLFPWVPKPIKLLFLLLVFLNSSSFAFLWHIRVWSHPIKAWIAAKTLGHRRYWVGWRRKHVAAGGLAHMRVKTWRRALFDDCDYNLHLSNSAYAKCSDENKMKFCIDAFAPCFVTGIHMALGASHWQFLREIPMGSSYLMETRIGGWGDKWIHCITEFVIYPPKGKKRVHRPDVADKPTALPHIDIPSGTDSGVDTPENWANGSANGHATGPSHDELMKRLMVQAREPRVDGGIIACIAVTDYCFKQGRVTVPPRIAMHMSLLSNDEERRAHALKLLTSPDGGAKFCRGGWKEDPLAYELGLDVALGEDGTQAWVEAGKEYMDGVGARLLQVALASP
ncbi:hypothetical protein CcaverHIS002_0104540 [Cutaneotrichosporon cavernicola]|uniref:Thioesterase/thiol ester dehydrase-isomerase n=1 Tax=Cutaneotrichosporon cavernicola TaxID=279322 RepID=A0AA48HYA0_9TREE|nr:uncharacterized protein CcaverHIS019_0104470 [Cutaneotrichosporon cavernicola]BEI79925.1 hypothetical protein CcaverHIS002_0104540 [Cutaneotrichosporon cavernicola]BEI87729.1 hypothetical protein CcaverHIS019_0104470 [Cutaneotrichosporon cavernicola]BEI95501.1 hypothetical protein CcaverHIS631_0104500 [Cutaneotrichosporon cavernicola]BEJ03275.1 hypothetical protein CcaverHIS641_0104500 [Cutaneotrichosporon cavernicola]